MKKNILFLLVSFLLVSYAKAQFNIETNNSLTVTICSGSFTDNVSGNYAPNADQIITFNSNDAINTNMKIIFSTFDIDPSDTLYIYDGMTSSAALIGKFNNNNPLTAEQSVVQAGIYNTSGALTFRFKTDATAQASGWNATIMCTKVCQKIISSLNTSLTIPNPSANKIDACMGDSITFVGNGIFPQNNLQYLQQNSNCTFQWNFGDNTTASGLVVKHKYNTRRAYDVSLVITDIHGCVSTNTLGSTVRLSAYPDLIVSPMPDLCTGTTTTLKVGYLSNSNVILKPLSFLNSLKASLDSTVFIPDGPQCIPGVTTLPINITSFPNGLLITDSSSISAICINIEHSYAGDLGFKITCPSFQSVVVDPNTHSGGAYLGEPFGGTTHGTYDNGCFPANNTSGTGWTYCWSESYPNNGHSLDWLCSNGGNTGTTGNTIDSTNQLSHTNYIKPQYPFSSLIGCPFNGLWTLQITDDYAIDNGYIFHWDLQLKNNLTVANSNYNVIVDSVSVTGSYLTQINDTVYNIIPITPGNYTYPIHLFDDFGCKWDTAIRFAVVQTPYVNLGNDTSFCEGNSILLNAGNAASSYLWNYPNNSSPSTQYILTKDSVLLAYPFVFNYIVKVTNANANIQCNATDSIKVTLNAKPSLSFFVVSNHVCEASQVNFYNQSLPTNATYHWDFGDGQTSSQYYTSHYYYAGVYNINFSAISPEGCTAISNNPNYITVYPKPAKPTITIKHGVSDTLISNVNIGNQWYKNGIKLVGDTNKMLIVSPNANGYFVDVIVNQYGCRSDNSNYFYVDIDEITADNKFFVYPNPFNNLINIKYNINKPAHISIKIFDITGRELKELFNSYQNNGTYNLNYNMADLKAGMYTITFEIGKEHFAKKIVKVD